MINLQLEEIKKELERARTVSLHVTMLHLFWRLNGNVTHKAIQLLDEKCQRAEKVRSDTLACGCYLRKTHGLPCVHKLFALMQDGKVLSYKIFTPFGKHLIWKL